jgi:hypothetical protein
MLTHLHVNFFTAPLPHTSLDPYQWASLFAAIGVLIWKEWFGSWARKFALFISASSWRLIFVDYIFLSWMIYFGYFSKQPFIYFQF